MAKDKSPKGSIDRDILPLLKKINSHACFQTTSSCSGRIVIISSLKKGRARWLFKSHSPVSAGALWKAMGSLKGSAWLLQEPMILHVKCDSLQAAGRLLSLANRAGFKAAGLSARTFTVEIRGSERMEVPIRKDLVSMEYVALLAREANAKLRKTKQRISLLSRYF